jgi:hypothetical protein
LFKASYAPTGSRSQLCEDAVFGTAFDAAKKRVNAMDIRFVEETDPVRQALLEIYIASALQRLSMTSTIISALSNLGLQPSAAGGMGSHRQLAYPANAETRMMFQRVILNEYEKLVGKEEPVPSVRSASERLRSLEQLKTDGLINDEEYNSKRKEILGEL